MKHAAFIAGLFLAAFAGAAFAGTHEGHHGRMMERLKAADTDGNGTIGRQEAAALPRLEKNFDAIDANRDGQVSFDELHAFRKAHRGHVRKLDTDGDGRISKAEAAGAPRLAERFDAIDANADGFVTRDEMKAARKARHASK